MLWAVRLICARSGPTRDRLQPGGSVQSEARGSLSRAWPGILASTLNALRAWMHWGLWVFAAGGALWVLKVAVITLNDLLGRDVDAMPVPVLYLSAVLLMVVGATAVGIAVLRRFPWWAQLLGAVAAVVALFVLYTVLDGIFKSAFEGVGPSWLYEELGILATGAICLVGGVLLARAISRRPHPSSPAF
jgi:hypothetical protein